VNNSARASGALFPIGVMRTTILGAPPKRSCKRRHQYRDWGERRRRNTTNAPLRAFHHHLDRQIWMLY